MICAFRAGNERIFLWRRKANARRGVRSPGVGLRRYRPTRIYTCYKNGGFVRLLHLTRIAGIKSTHTKVLPILSSDCLNCPVLLSSPRWKAQGPLLERVGGHGLPQNTSGRAEPQGARNNPQRHSAPDNGRRLNELGIHIPAARSRGDAGGVKEAA